MERLSPLKISIKFKTGLASPLAANLMKQTFLQALNFSYDAQSPVNNMPTKIGGKQQPRAPVSFTLVEVLRGPILKC